MSIKEHSEGIAEINRRHLVLVPCGVSQWCYLTGRVDMPKQHAQCISVARRFLSNDVLNITRLAAPCIL